MLQTIEKASDVLALFDRDHAEWGVREVALTLGLAKSSAHDLLASLAQIGFLGKTEEGRYRLGWRLVALSETLLATTELRREARPVLEELAAQYQETIHLAVLDDTKVVYVDKLEGKQAVRVELTSLGTRLYAHCTALGKVLLAYQPEADVERIVKAEGLPRFTANTITGEGELKQALSQVRQQGYAFDLEEILPDLCCVGAPVHNYTGRVIAAISMSIPAYRFQRSRTEFSKAIMRAGKMVSEKLGYYGSIQN
ncbi:MAG: IclR family transcriptional regulator [Chloroflexi bacterium]|nr:IclR family transcriptional regulator [Chloroflexota bacterium]MCI0650032.1 IclR family transcriptional regulator [Chloroflexota bacterium]MCI0730484.1 IclR family transcriptional regulator [Chloroflexota bacterium]